jgi:hypothetical protein
MEIINKLLLLHLVALCNIAQNILHLYNFLTMNYFQPRRVQQMRHVGAVGCRTSFGVLSACQSLIFCGFLVDASRFAIGRSEHTFTLFGRDLTSSLRGCIVCFPMRATWEISLFFLWRCAPTRAMTSSFLRFQDHTQRRTTVGRTPLDE